MLTFDFKTYGVEKINSSYLEKKEEVLDSFSHHLMTGWYYLDVSSEMVNQVKELAKEVLSSESILVVVGIGGSYMGSYSIMKALTNSYDYSSVIYLGYHLSSRKMREALTYLKDKDYYVNVISKSGNTLEVKTTYQMIMEEVSSKYSEEEVRKRVIVTTNQKSGYLYEEACKNQFRTLEIPDSIGGRFSLMTAAHLFPLACASIDIDSLIKGYHDGKKYLEEAYFYACCRRNFYDLGKMVENFSIYEPCLFFYTEFLKQLFGESEGKEKKGILPISTVNTRDLHSLGQFLQEGNPIVFETLLKVSNDCNDSLSMLNDIVISSVLKAHYEDHVYSNVIMLSDLSSYTLGELSMFFMLAASFSAFLFGVDPFNQPGVEKYKKIVSNFLEKE